jgi:tetratricopeptide (TPR) repeat protein
LPDTAQYTSTRVDYLNWSAAALADAGRLDEALSKCEAGDRLNPARGTGPRAYLLVRYLEATDPEGKNPALNSRREEALAAEDEAIRLNPNDAQCYYDRAIVHTMRGEADAALADCDAALKFRPDWIDLHYRRGIVHATLKGDYTKALADMEEANRADPNNAAVRSWLARLRARGAGSR